MNREIGVEESPQCSSRQFEDEELFWLAGVRRVGEVEVAAGVEEVGNHRVQLLNGGPGWWRRGDNKAALATPSPPAKTRPPPEMASDWKEGWLVRTMDKRPVVLIWLVFQPSPKGRDGKRTWANPPLQLAALKSWKL